MQLGSHNVRIVVWIENTVRFQFRIQMIGHFLCHVGVGIQLITEHVRRRDTVLKPEKTKLIAIQNKVHSASIKSGFNWIKSKLSISFKSSGSQTYFLKVYFFASLLFFDRFYFPTARRQ
jgi:hypothetical protein